MRPVSGIHRTGSCRAVAGAQHIDADDEVVIQREHRAGREDFRPPGAYQRRAGECMANQYGVVAGCIQPAIHRIMQRNAGQRVAALQQQRLVEHKVAFVGGGQGCPFSPVVLARLQPLRSIQSYVLLCNTHRHHRSSWRAMSVGNLDRLIEIGQNIANILDAHREPHQLGSDAGRPARRRKAARASSRRDESPATWRRRCWPAAKTASAS